VATSGSKLKGGACGYYTKVGLFGGPPELRGCGQSVPPGTETSASPEVTLPAEGSSTAVTAEEPNGAAAVYGPAIVFGGKGDAELCGPMTVSTKGKTSVTSSASVKNLSAGPFVADGVKATCSASKSGTSGSTTITKGVVVLGTDADGNPTKSEKIPSKPPVNHTVKGVNSAGDKFRAVFNEQKVAKDGTITVTGMHMYLLGPVAKGDVVVAQCRAKA
jgi:hypothetical protein